MSLDSLFSSYLAPSTSPREASTSPHRATSIGGADHLIFGVIRLIGEINRREDNSGASCQLDTLSEQERAYLINTHSILGQDRKNWKGLSLQDYGFRTILFGQIHSGEHIQNSNQTQYTIPSSVGAEVWRDLLKQIRGQDASSLPNLIVTLDTYAQRTQRLSRQLTREDAGPDDFAQLATEVTRDIYELPPQGCYLLEGGFTHYPIVFEFIRKSADHFDLYIYLPGAQDIVGRPRFYHHHKTWNCPTLYFQSIPESTLFFTPAFGHPQPLFFESILKYRYLPTQNHSRSLLSTNLLNHLSQYQRSTSSTQFQTAERDYIPSPWSAVKPFIVRRLGKEAYKRVSLQIKLNSLFEFYKLEKSAMEEDSPLGSLKRSLLKNAAQRLLKNLAVAHSQHHRVDESLDREARATALDCLQTLEAIEKKFRRAVFKLLTS